jgi:tagatose-1,6-bisphosphate aldolase non-catalytic subunit AgaZ/GatZ
LRVRAERAAGEARAVADSIEQPYERERALAVLGTAVAVAGFRDRAEAIAGVIADADERLRILVEVARALIAQGLAARASRLIAVELAAAPESLRMFLPLLPPQALEAISDSFLSDAEGSDLASLS